MKQCLTTENFSVETDIISDLEEPTAKERRSRNDIFCDMYRSYIFNGALDEIQTAAQAAIASNWTTAEATLGLATS